ncbi:MAG: HAD family hydrolase [Firmicutes bacterium ML8_F2]|jgi:putative hydrolases of HD superfamily|nr:MAG: HAD family hydrolase [Firmicutes bacterium ML8_F2]
MIRKELLELLFEAASIQRWNDHIRPEHFTELDKQAHKMFYAFVLAKIEESDRGAKVDWQLLIEGSIFEFLQRIVITDIKPPIYYRLMAEKGEQLNRWVLDQLQDKICDLSGSMKQKMEEYFFSSGSKRLERRILKAAHYLATNWEFKIIYRLNEGLYGLEETRAAIANQIEEHYDLAGVQKLTLGKKTSNFLDLVGQLRFQLRWAQSPRVPKTSVMGHMLIVAMMAYLCSLEVEACPKRVYNNYFAGLFHDLPEVLTRDIVSPVKRSVAGLEEIIKDIENRQLEERIFPLLPSSWHQELKFFTDNEFASKIVENDKMRIVTSEDINECYNSNLFSPLDGEIIRACDHLAAYIETFLSISHGIKSNHLEEGNRQLYSRYNNSIVAGINFGQLFSYFKI